MHRCSEVYVWYVCMYMAMKQAPGHAVSISHRRRGLSSDGVRYADARSNCRPPVSKRSHRRRGLSSDGVRYADARSSCRPPALKRSHRRRGLASDGVRSADARSSCRPPVSKRYKTNY